MLLDNHDSVDVSAFLSGYWQKKPLLIKGALPAFSDYLSPQELAGLACEEEVESRLVFSRNGDWQLKTGPFSERDFTFLPETHWTLLVQSVDHWLPAVKALLQAVPFIPGWRLDDVMVSYAARNGGVGPHFDYYDVFLVQGAGRRRWQLGQDCTSATPLDTSSGLKILVDFEPSQEVELETGDVLYIPAGLAHWGTAIEAGLCYSIGFRAPDVAELLGAFSLLAAESLPQDLRYRDPALQVSQSPGEIDTAALQQAKALMQHALSDGALLLQSFGRLMTEPRMPDQITHPDRELGPEDMAVRLQKGMTLAHHPASRFACHHHNDTLYFFVNGECLVFAEANKWLLGLNDEIQRAIGRNLDVAKFQRNADCLRLLATLYNHGSLVRGS